MRWQSVADDLVTVVLVAFLSLYVVADMPLVKSLTSTALMAIGWLIGSLLIHAVRSYVERRKARQAILRAWASR